MQSTGSRAAGFLGAVASAALSASPPPPEYGVYAWAAVVATAAHWLIGEFDRWLPKTDRDVALYVCPLIVTVIAFIGLKATVFEPSPIEIFKSGPGLALVDDKLFTITRDTPQLLSLGNCKTECIWIDVADWDIPKSPEKPSVSLLIGGMTDGSGDRPPPVPGSFHYFGIGMQLAEGVWCEALLNNFSIRV